MLIDLFLKNMLVSTKICRCVGRSRGMECYIWGNGKIIRYTVMGFSNPTPKSILDSSGRVASVSTGGKSRRNKCMKDSSGMAGEKARESSTP